MSHATPPTAHTPSSSPAGASQIESTPAWTWGVIVAIILIVYITILSKSCKDKPPAPVVAPAANITRDSSVEALVLMHECTTPCSADIRYKAKIRTDGDPLQIKFQGVAEWFDHPGKGAVGGPPGVQVGEAQFVSADERNPHVKVWVYKITGG